jgi:hypothetical protein
MDTNKISSRVADSSRGFLNLIKGLGDNVYSSQLKPEAVADEFDRFKIWVGNIAAHRKSNRSLDYRLRDASYLKDRVLELLAALQDGLAEGMCTPPGRTEAD